jgi:hypothetical protein
MVRCQPVEQFLALLQGEEGAADMAADRGIASPLFNAAD